MISTISTHCENRRTDGHGEDRRTRRGRTDAQRLAALRWPRFTFGEFYLIDSPPFLSLWFDLERKKCHFLTLFLSFPKSMFFPCFNLVLTIIGYDPVFGTVPVLSPCFSLRDLFPDGQFNSVYWTKPKPKQWSKMCPCTPCFVCSGY